MKDAVMMSLRNLPSVDEVLRVDEIGFLLMNYPREMVTEAVRKAIGCLRDSLVADSEGMPGTREENTALLAGEVSRLVYLSARPSLRRVINATGVVLHTNLGRAVLSTGAVDAVLMAASGYSNTELNLETGKRGSRYAILEGLLSSLTGAEACLVVNNNAAAVLLVLSTLARGKEVIVSRGQLVEIGGAFRIPEVMSQSGAILVEVGATNKTHPEDYARAITDSTAALLHVHTSNYRIVGFTRETSIEEMAALGSQRGIPVVSDLGSGFLVDMERFGLPQEPMVRQAVKAGAQVVTFSGDKLLGGPQAGVIVGKKEYIEKMKKNPLTRAVRIDKLTLAALEATLREYLDTDRALSSVPTLRMLSLGLEELKWRAEALAELLVEACDNSAEIELIEGNSAVGGGAMPTAGMPTVLVTLKPREKSVTDLAGLLRQGDPAVLVRLQEGKMLFDVRTLLKGEDMVLAGAVSAALSKRGGML